MLWLIWIALMLLTPVLAGIRVWLRVTCGGRPGGKRDGWRNPVDLVASKLLDQMLRGSGRNAQQIPRLVNGGDA